MSTVGCKAGTIRMHNSMNLHLTSTLKKTLTDLAASYSEFTRTSNGRKRLAEAVVETTSLNIEAII